MGPSGRGLQVARQAESGRFGERREDRYPQVVNGRRGKELVGSRQDKTRKQPPPETASRRSGLRRSRFAQPEAASNRRPATVGPLSAHNDHDEYAARPGPRSSQPVGRGQVAPNLRLSQERRPNRAPPSGRQQPPIWPGFSPRYTVLSPGARITVQGGVRLDSSFPHGAAYESQNRSRSHRLSKPASGTGSRRERQQ